MKRHVMRMNAGPRSGFTLIEIMIVVAIIGLLAAIAIPNFAKMRTKAQRQACIMNLKTLDSAKEAWRPKAGKPTAMRDEQAVNSCSRRSGARVPRGWHLFLQRDRFPRRAVCPPPDTSCEARRWPP